MKFLIVGSVSRILLMQSRLRERGDLHRREAESTDVAAASGVWIQARMTYLLWL